MSKVVFILHRMATDQAYVIDDVSQGLLEEWLSKHHAQMPRLSKIDQIENQDWKILLTFDDGYSCNFDIVMDMLEKYSVTAIFFVISDYLGKPGYLNKSQLKKMAEKNFIIGSHTVSHADCSKLNFEDFTHELQESKRSLEKIIQKEIKYFSFPYGREFKNFEKRFFNTYQFYFNSKPGLYDEKKNVINRYPLNSLSKSDSIKKIFTQDYYYILGYAVSYRIKELIKSILPLRLYQFFRQKF